MNEFRQDPISKQWVIISTDRELRPNEFEFKDGAEKTEAVDADSSEACPFCAHQMDTPPILARYGDSSQNGDWQVCVVRNRFPVLDSPATGIVAPEDLRMNEGVPAQGLHEVVIESPTHCESPSDLSNDQVFFMLQAYRDRMLAMREVPGVRYVLPMKNSGRNAGASLRHSHSQLFALPMVPDRVRQELHGVGEHWDAHGCCLFCDLIGKELTVRERIVVETDDFVAWCPYASRFNYEIWLAPRQHRARFEDTDNLTLRKLGKVLAGIFNKLDKVSRITAFNYLLHSQPFDSNQQDHYHWHIEILPRVSKKAGFEWGTGIHINTVNPDRAASELRIT